MTDRIFTKNPPLTSIIYCACFLAHSGTAADHSNGVEGGTSLSFVLYFFVLSCFVAQISETDTQSVFYVFVFFLTHLVSITHPPFQATINMSVGSGAEDCRAGMPPEDESNASRFHRDAEAAAVAATGAELGRGGVQLSSAAIVFLFSCSILRRRLDHSNGID